MCRVSSCLPHRFSYIKLFCGKAAISCQFQYVWQQWQRTPQFRTWLGCLLAAFFWNNSMKYSQFLFNILETYLTGLSPCTQYIVSISPSSRMQQTWVSFHDGDDAATPPPERTQPQKLCTANFSSGTLKTHKSRPLRLKNNFFWWHIFDKKKTFFSRLKNDSQIYLKVVLTWNFGSRPKIDLYDHLIY